MPDCIAKGESCEMCVRDAIESVGLFRSNGRLTVRTILRLYNIIFSGILFQLRVLIYDFFTISKFIIHYKNNII